MQQSKYITDTEIEYYYRYNKRTILQIQQSNNISDTTNQ